MSSQTERALDRHRRGESVAQAARLEQVDPSTLFRALRRMKERNDGAPGRFVIVGAGGFGRELHQWMLCDRIAQKVVFLDDRVNAEHVLGSIESYQREDGDQVLIAIGDCRAKQAAAERFKTLGRYISCTAVVADSRISEGVIISPNVIVSTGTVIGACTHLNLGATIGHDAHIGDYCQLSPHVGISGWVRIGNRCFLGSGAQVIPRVTIGDDCVIGAGAVVISDVEPGSTVVGNPARRIK